MKGVECEEPPQAPGVLCLLPGELARFAQESVFEPEDVTFCFWRLTSEESWSFVGSSLETAAQLLTVVSGHAEEYVRRAHAYYARPIVRSMVAKVFSFEPLTIELVSALNPDACWLDVAGEANEIGYPVAGGEAY